MTEDPHHDNYGVFVQKIQVSACSTTPRGEPWCMDYIQFCVNHVNSILYLLTGRQWSLFLRSESCLNVYKSYVKKGGIVYDAPFLGAVVIWDRGNGHGHCGIVTAPEYGTAGNFLTVEGNTSDPDYIGPEHKPEGVYEKTRSLHTPPAESWTLKGFIDPWDGFDSATKKKSNNTI